jgi:hypothetical protein
VSIVKHGDAHDGPYARLYTIWRGMRRRCHVKTCSMYPTYGARGIAVCDEWRGSYIRFKEWALGNGYESHLQIDRRDNERGYSPENCRWVTCKVNLDNRRNSKKLVVRGEVLTPAQAADKFRVVSAMTIRARLARGWSHEAAVLTPRDTTRTLSEKCLRGHMLSDEKNVYRNKHGSRSCRACNLDRSRVRWAARRRSSS